MSHSTSTTECTEPVQRLALRHAWTVHDVRTPVFSTPTIVTAREHEQQICVIAHVDGNVRGLDAVNGRQVSLGLSSIDMMDASVHLTLHPCDHILCCVLPSCWRMLYFHVRGMRLSENEKAKTNMDFNLQKLHMHNNFQAEVVH